MGRRHFGTRFLPLDRRRQRIVTLVAAIGASAVGVGFGQSTSAATSAPVAPVIQRPVTPATHLAAGVMPKVHPGPQVAAAPAGAHLTYYGGHVISNVQVIQVLYGSGTYTSEVSDPSTTDGTSISSFYTGATNSTYFDWLSEYNTTITASNGQPGTNQLIGRGSFVRQVQITPSAANNGSTVDDTNIQAELQSQIAAGHLPASNANTLYTVYFRAGQTITQGGQSSGVAFCAYHGTVASGSVPEFYYSVLPDFTTGGMTSGCGNGTRFQNETSVSSHELIEAVTDAEVGLATSNAPPLAWYDSTNGEIGDICNGQQQAITGGDGHSYTVQQEFSNQQNNCVVSGPAGSNDFSMSVSPASASVVAGSSATAVVSTAVTAGAASTVSLSASGLPSGAGAGFNPASVTAGGSSTLTVTTATTTPAGTYALTITGVEGSKTHTAPFSLTVTGTPPTTTTTVPSTTTTTVPSGGQLLGNPGFETGSAAPWTATAGVINNGGTEPAHSGSWDAWLDGYGVTHTDTLSQSVTIASSASSATMSLWLHIDTAETSGVHDTLSLQVLNSSGAVLATVHTWSNLNAGAGYSQQSFDFSAYKGLSITVKFTGTEDASNQTSFVIDDTALTTSGGPPPTTTTVPPTTTTTTTVPPTTTTTTTVPATTTTTVSGGQLLGNPGFETGSAPPWTATAGVINNSSGEPPHSGSWDAWLDGYGTTHTDTLAQSVSIPGSVSTATLSFWLHIDTAETTTTTAYDTLTLQVLSSSGTLLATVHTWSNLNAKSGYSLQSFDFSAYKGKNVTIKFTGSEDYTLQTSFVLDDAALTTH